VFIFSNGDKLDNAQYPSIEVRRYQYLNKEHLKQNAFDFNSLGRVVDFSASFVMLCLTRQASANRDW
jgi:hypothetical protein